MKAFVPKEKASKKARREMDQKQRVTWAFKPTSRVKESAKRYLRHKKGRPDDYCPDGLLLFFAQYCAKT